MAALLCDLQPGDKIIAPSYTDTMNLDHRLNEGAITEHTCVIAPVHYAGIERGMNAIMGIARRRNLLRA
ncbi:uncharacterized protein ATNIH1004_007450 [Aspergillus tanneri]|uniref:Uncharacterized protein n=1 Tax=Aspergillus tanneri TaxID=1220188 RepID=A0A5M9MGD2_9EURO|nr:uncharacterized protein ATNIH1004_007450 [Aspergillus tanneri]KAA8646028.1 hypothetical protein ATNIH1004_007450 [Aspergillus tanneri]